jgi:probable rRNA maturation factor
VVAIEIEAEIPLTDEEQTAVSTIQAVLDKVAEIEQLPAVSASVTFVGKGRIQALNAEHRQKNAVTDVLSFPLFAHREEWTKEDWEDTIELGDIIVCMPRAHEQAIEYGHTLLREVCFLVVHGFLHLLGYDHETAEEEATMFGLQEEVLSQLGITR